ncbi:MAG: PASTA domain-containing protein [Deltaproteobacteria bacterium]|nr:PASTA domain-containing protein [Deltaproteobacteria bacterium]MBW1873892.1 PASTA domain-containing protein [Deltaproteobacteria bacterium]MBW2209442.1 PASTA domain-containing protein [Deltaproteobacteria bacterium]MBW2212857.1 PASTA domain-containing protein [Deltaproteobacteria bacterium]MBW2549171.1 PASTA domain-containing protein [Deltaproteobacteria bacterium]
MKNRRQRWFRARIALLGACVMCVAMLVVVRAFHVQISSGDRLREMAEDQHIRHLRVSPRRGAIYDRHGAELAVSVDVDSVYANPRRLEAMEQDPTLVAKRIAKILDVDPRRLAKRLGSDRYFVWIERRVTPHEATRIRELDIPGVELTTEARRYYPNRHLAAHLVGFADIDGRGIEGIELAYEDRLRGADRRVEAIRDRRGHVVFADKMEDDRTIQGQSVVLTIDKAIQHIAERELALGVRTFEARGGSVVVMDPSTGEILALANYPPFNPNEPSKHPTAHRRNRAVVDRFEPGSTVKPFTMAAALAAGAVKPNQSINCENGVTRIGGRLLHDAHPYEWLTPTQILAYSSNIGTAKIAQALGKKDLYRGFRRFGFGEPTGLGVPGETAGILRHYRRWYEIDTAAVSFGQGMSVTNVQMATAMSAIANGGRLMQPMLVRRMTDGHGATVEENKPRVRRQVVPRRVAKLVGQMLTAVTEPGGTAIEAAIDGYLVAGKTGTAQKADYVHGGYAKDKWLASFIGFAPADRPSVVISVVIDEPVIAHYGGTVAGPVFRRIAEVTLRHMGIAPEGRQAVLAKKKERQIAPAEAEPAPEEEAVEKGESAVPDVRSLPLRQAVIALHAESLVAEVEGSGVVLVQHPAPGKAVAHGSVVQLQLERRRFDADVAPPQSRTRALTAAVSRRPHAP